MVALARSNRASDALVFVGQSGHLGREHLPGPGGEPLGVGAVVCISLPLVSSISITT